MLFLLITTGCAGSAPEETSEGPRVAASLKSRWRTAAPARQASFSRDGKLLAASDASGHIIVRRTADWRDVAKFDHPGGATSVVFSRDGRRLFTGGYDGAVRIWDLARRAPAAVLGGAQGTIWSLDLSPDGDRLAAAGEDRTIRIWRLGSGGSPLILKGHSRNIWVVRFSPDGRQLASGSFDNTVRLWDTATGAPLRTLSGHGEAVVGLAYSPGGGLIASGSDDSTIRLWRAKDGARLRRIDNGNHVYALAFTADGRWLASAGRARGGLGTLWHQLSGGGGEAYPVRLWRMGDAALVDALPHPDDVMSVALDPAGRWLVTSGEDNAVRLWRLTSRR